MKFRIFAIREGQICPVRIWVDSKSPVYEFDSEADAESALKGEDPLDIQLKPAINKKFTENGRRMNATFTILPIY